MRLSSLRRRVNLLILMLLFICSGAWCADKGVGAKPADMVANTSEATVGIREQLGSRIPLDITFRDESGRPVRLAELITGPTIILPVYYSCTNVCYNLQWGLAQVLPRIRAEAG